MANTIDNYTVKVNAEGVSTLDQVNAKLTSIDESAKKTATAMNQVQGGVRNVAYQIQDLAVQLSMGTNAFMALGQQLPQLLSGFGTMGVVIGAVAAVGIPLLQAGLKAAGVDMRNLKEMTDDLAKSTDAYIVAQRQNQTTLEGLRSRYGSLSEEAKKFFDLQERLNQSKAQRDAIDTVKELRDEYTRLGEEGRKANLEQPSIILPGSVIGRVQNEYRLFSKGLTEAQANDISKMLKDIDAASPEKTVTAINNVLNYLKEIGPEGEKFKQSFEKSVEPLMKINAELIKQKENIRAAAQDASALSTALLGIQNRFTPDVNAAKRNFDQINAAQLEGRMKLAEFDRQMAEKNKDGVDRTAEAEAGRLRIQQETNDKIKDFTKSQQETYYAAQLTNEAKLNQLLVQGKINTLQAGQLESINYQSILEESVLKNIYDQQQALAGIEELRRKNAITEERAIRLREQAGEIRDRADKNSEQTVTKIAADNARNIRIQVEGLATQNSIKERSLALDAKIFGFSSLRQDAEKKLFDVQNQRDREIANINNNNRLSDAEKLDALIKINNEYRRSKELVEEEYQARIKLDASVTHGATQRMKELQESFSNFKVGGMMVDSVFGNMSSAIDKFVETGKFKFSDFANGVIMDLIKIQLKASATQILSATLGGFGITLPGKASGGPVDANSPYIVGESGPELFIPRNAGNIVPNGQLAGMRGGSGGGTTIINNISAVDAKSVARLFSENKMTLLGTVEQARRELPLRTR